MDFVYYVAGIGFLALAKAKHVLRGYATPKPIDPADVDRCVSYDRAIADTYLGMADVRGKHVLELGPGSDLGVGILLIKAGAASYTAVDRHALAGPLATAIHDAMGGRPKEVDYVVCEDFQFAPRLERRFDIAFSNAAFEHFDDVPDVARQLRKVMAPGGRICVSIDLQTHSRWIREKDPANIYRYPRWLYRLFYFPGQPNRVRPSEYRRAFESAGFTDVSTSATARLPVKGRFHSTFDPTDLDHMTVALRATM